MLRMPEQSSMGKRIIASCNHILPNHHLQIEQTEVVKVQVTCEWPESDHCDFKAVECRAEGAEENKEAPGSRRNAKAQNADGNERLEQIQMISSSPQVAQPVTSTRSEASEPAQHSKNEGQCSRRRW